MSCSQSFLNLVSKQVYEPEYMKIDFYAKKHNHYFIYNFKFCSLVANISSLLLVGYVHTYLFIEYL